MTLIADYANIDDAKVQLGHKVFFYSEYGQINCWIIVKLLLLCVMC